MSTTPTPPNERVYTLTNAADGNAVAVFSRQATGNLVPLTVDPTKPVDTVNGDGALHPIPAFPTGGRGAAAPLISQSALTLSDDGTFLFAVNPGSNDVSSFLVTRSGLQFVNKVPSGGVLPVSVATFGNLVYVVNAVNNLVGTVGFDGDVRARIAGFTVDLDGVLTPLEGSIRSLNPPSQPSPLRETSVPAQVAFNTDGTLLVVTEFFTSRIAVFEVQEDGRPGTMVENPSAGRRPFGFAFNSRGNLIVSEFQTGASNDSSVSSYDLSPGGELTVISAAVPTNQDAACWIANTPDARFSYTSNTRSGSISGYGVDDDGRLTLLDPDGRTGVTGDNSVPIDMVISADGQYLDVLAAGSQTITTFRIGDDGSLTPLASVGNLPPVAVGLAIGSVNL